MVDFEKEFPSICTLYWYKQSPSTHRFPLWRGTSNKPEGYTLYTPREVEKPQQQEISIKFPCKTFMFLWGKQIV